MEARLTEEGVWELPPLEEILTEGERRWMQNGFSKRKRAERHKKITAEYELYQQAISRWREGVSYHFIGKELGKAGTVIRYWIERGQLPQVLSGIVYQKRQTREVTIPEEPNEQMLRLIGLTLATTRTPGKYKQRWNYEKDNPIDPMLNYARRVLTSVFGADSFHEHVKQSAEKTKIWYQIIFQSVTFFEYYNSITRNSTRLPVEQMSTLEAKLVFAEAFCRGILTVENEHQRGRYETPPPAGLTVVKKTTPESQVILEQAALLLNDFGCYPHVGIHPRMSVLHITDPDDILLLLSYGLVPESCKAAAEMIASGTTGRNIRGQHRILQAYDAARKLPEGLTSEVIAQKQDIAARYDFPMNLVGKWYCGDSKPRIAHRRDILERLRKKYSGWPAPNQHVLHAADKDVLAFLPVTPRNAPVRHYLAQRYSLDEARFYVSALERAQIERNEWLRWLMLPKEILNARLDRAAPVIVTANGTVYHLSWHALHDYCQMERFQPYEAPGEEWRKHLRTIRDCLPEKPEPGQTTHHHDEFTFTLAHSRDKVVVTGIQ